MDLRDYADKIAGLYSANGDTGPTPWRLLADHGTEGTFTPLPAGESCGQAKGCYKNATHRALTPERGQPELTYYEGLCMSGGLPIEHAWCQDDDGRVYELTLRHNDDRCGFCYGAGSIHPTEHWDYEEPDEDADWGIEDESEEIQCEQCEGSGLASFGPVDRTGTTYLGIAVPTETLRASVIENQVYGVLYHDPARVAEALGV